jgi:hypothetical protein
MAKRICDPTVGSIGRQTYLMGRNGQVVRTRAVPSNPRSVQQVTARDNLKLASKMWDTITEVQRAAWRAAAALMQTKSRLGMSGAMTGNQLFVKVNAALAEISEPLVVSPPSIPEDLASHVDALSITNTGGTIVIRFHTTDAPPDDTMIWAAAPQRPGVERTPQMVCLGTLGSPVATYCVITVPYTGRFGVPAVGQKVFAAVKTNVNGYEGTLTAFSAFVPAST